VTENNADNALRYKQNKEQLEELIIQNRELKDQLDWTETRLNE
jgi:hypothetical protein